MKNFIKALFALFRLIIIVVYLLLMLIVPNEMTVVLTAWAIRALGVKGSIASAEDATRFKTFYHSNGPGVIVYNHPTFYDFAVIIKEFGYRFNFVALSKRMIFPMNFVGKRMGCLMIQPNTKASVVITNHIRNRQKSASILAVAPAAGNIVDSCDDTLLPPFRSGAFIAQSPVLPIVIRYCPYEPWDPSISFYETLKTRLLTGEIRYRVHVLPAMYPNKNEYVQDFMKRVKTAMETVPSYKVLH